MPLNYKLLKMYPVIFEQITGLKVEEFDTIVALSKEKWDQIELNKKRHGRTPNLKNLEDKILCAFIHYHTDMTHTLLGSLFHLHNSNVCRMLKKIEKLDIIYLKKTSIKKNYNLDSKKIIKMLEPIINHK